MSGQNTNQTSRDLQTSQGDSDKQPEKPHTLLWHCLKLVGLHKPPEDTGDLPNAALAVIIMLAGFLAVGAGLGATLRLLWRWQWLSAIAAGCAVLLVILALLYGLLSRRWVTESQRVEKVRRYGWWVALCFAAVGVVSWAVIGSLELLPTWTTRANPTESIPTPVATQPEIRISYIEYDPQGLEYEEYVLIENSGAEARDLSGWTLEDEAYHVFRFPAFSLGAGTSVRVWTKEGQNSSTDLYWGYRRAIWDNDGDTACLKDSRGQLVDEYGY